MPFAFLRVTNSVFLPNTVESKSAGFKPDCVRLALLLDEQAERVAIAAKPTPINRVLNVLIFRLFFIVYSFWV
ncbi:Uncharacterised protein [Segatella copri]|nr:Uncharacterised protein [Segatella copri]